MIGSDFQIRPLDAPLGAEVIGFDARSVLTESARAELVAAWHRHSLLLFRGQELTPEEQYRFASIFGEVQHKDRYAQIGWLFISNVSLPEGAYTGFGELLLHSDSAMDAEMESGTMLYAIEVPPQGVGGDTLFSNSRLVYNTLPEGLRSKLHGLTIRHSRKHSEIEVTTEQGIQKASGGANDLRQADRPLVLRHPITGDAVLLVCRRYSTRILEVSPEESTALVQELLSYQDRDDVVYRHSWLPGDVIIWDNIGLQHARTDFDSKYRRILRRITVGSFAAMDPA